MTNSMKLINEETPKWDIALEGLAKDTYRIKGSGLYVDDFHQLALDHAIRFDDIMVTMFELCIYGEWQYQEDSEPVEITRDTLDRLFVDARLQEKDMSEFAGGWSPAG